MNSSKSADGVRDELADVMIYLTRIASILGVDLIKEANAKIDRNEIRFPPN
jgi:NTP pyrophosphatase (non-canonical NTP hydrolase)